MLYSSPIGGLLISAENGAVTKLCFAAGAGESSDTGTEEPVLLQTARWLDGYFAGAPASLPPVAPTGTEFQRRVWQALCAIPFGETRTYGDIARSVGCASARAVGGAIGRNPILILIPCHRVIGADGSLTGFSAGLEHKIDLLEHEQRFT